MNVEIYIYIFLFCLNENLKDFNFDLSLGKVHKFHEMI